LVELKFQEKIILVDKLKKEFFMNKGQNLTEFVILIILVSIIAIVALSSMGTNITQLFNACNVKIGAFDPFGGLLNNSIKSSTVEPGKLGGTETKAVKSCVDGVCAIDFGDYVLNGIPENFSVVTETSGTPVPEKNLHKCLFNLLNKLPLMEIPICKRN
jgi:hypothetical protein